METTNNPGEGTGFGTMHDAQAHIESLMDSPKATTEREEDAETETTEEIEEVSNTSEDEAEQETLEDTDQSEGEESEAEESEEAEDVTPSKFEIPDEATIEIDGNTVTGKELKLGYLRQSDYTKKSQEIAEVKRAYLANQHDLAAVRGEQSKILEGLMDALTVANEGITVPDFDFLSENDPGEYVRQKALWERKQLAYQRLQGEREKVAKQEADYKQTVLAHAKQHAYEALVQHVPEFADPVQAKANLSRIENDLKHVWKFSQGEIDNVSDPRLIAMALESLMWREHLNKVPTAVQRIEKKPALTMPGTVSRGKSENNSLKAARQQQKASGGTEATANLLGKYFE